MMEITDKSKILIYGYGVEGQSTKAYFDRREDINPDQLTIYDEFKEDYNAQPNLGDFDIIVVSAGINPDQKIPTEHRGKCTSNVALFFHSLSTNNRVKTIGITGTKGKSTTTKLIHESLLKAGKKSAIAGNFGKGLLDLSEVINDLDFLVIELSSYQLASLDVSPHYAICTNLYEDHLNWHGNLDHYQQSKSHLWKYQGKEDIFFIPVHQEKHPLFNLSTQQLSNVTTKIICPPAPAELFAPDTIWQSEHYLQNFGLALGLMKYLDQSLSSQIPKFSSSFKATCQTFKGLPHRLDFISEHHGIKWYDDAISTNPKSTIAAIKFFDQKLRTLLLGGQDRDQNFETMFEEMVEINPSIHIIVLPSETQNRLQQLLDSRFSILDSSFADSMEAAVEIAIEKTPKGQICLLSPAAPSFDKYKNYIAKGEDFQDNIRKATA